MSENNGRPIRRWKFKHCGNPNCRDCNRLRAEERTSWLRKIAWPLTKLSLALAALAAALAQLLAAIGRLLKGGNGNGH